MTLHNTIIKRIQLIILTLLYGLAVQHKQQKNTAHSSMMRFRLPYLAINLHLLTNVTQMKNHPEHTIITSSIIFPLKEMNIAIHKEGLFIISSTCLHREILSSIIGKQTIRQDRVLPLFMF